MITLTTLSEHIKDRPSVYFLFNHTPLDTLPLALSTQLEFLKQEERFDTSVKSIKVIDIEKNQYCLVGLGDIKTFSYDIFRQCTFNLFKVLLSEKYKEVNVHLPKTDLSKAILLKVFVEMSHHSMYQFDKYKDDAKKIKLTQINIIEEGVNDVLKNAFQDGMITGECSNIAKVLVDEPANVLTPKKLSEEAKALGKTHGFDVDVFTEDKIKKLGMNAYLDVAKGSSHRPHLIVMRYKGNKHSDQIMGLVGKGLTYDSGGYSIKTHAGLIDMKSDMAGAAAVIGALCAIAKAKLEVNVTAVVAACENSISSTSYRPGDVLTSMSGKTILCENTDAEGRFTLVDAITYIQREENVSSIIDIATLTGAAIFSLGDVAALTISNNDDFYQSFQEAIKVTGEKVWRMPLFNEYEEQVKSTIADYTNMGGRPGAITAAALLKAFVEEERPWIHLDIAGMALYTSPKSYYAKGASGYGVKSLYEFIKSQQN